MKCCQKRQQDTFLFLTTKPTLLKGCNSRHNFCRSSYSPLNMPAHKLPRRARVRPIRMIYGDRPANGEAQTVIWPKTRFMRKGTDQVKRHAHHLGADRIFATNYILTHIIGWAASVDRPDRSVARSAGKLMHGHFHECPLPFRHNRFAATSTPHTVVCCFFFFALSHAKEFASDKKKLERKTKAFRAIKGKQLD